jgi:hypothetical protein
MVSRHDRPGVRLEDLKNKMVSRYDRLEGLKNGMFSRHGRRT